MHANAIAQGYETWWTKSLSWQFIIPLYFWTSAWKHENAFSILVGRALRCSFWRNSQKKKNKKKMRRLLSPRQLLRKKDHRSSPACVAAELKTFWSFWCPLLHWASLLFCGCSPSISTISSTSVIHCKVVCAPLICKKMMKNVAYRPIGDPVLVTGAEGSNCGGWSTRRNCRGIL